MKAETILVVEDDAKTAASLRRYLEHAGFRVSVAVTGRKALEITRQVAPDLLLLDLMLPEGSGLEVCRTLRSESSIPIIMLTALTLEEDKLHGLDLGADDYITKPFSPREVVSRVRAVLRRTVRPETIGPAVMTFGDVTVFRREHRVSVRTKPVQLTLTEFRLLEAFLSSPGRVLTRDELLQQALGRDSDALDRTVDAHVKNLRNKLTSAGLKESVIVTVHGVGYKLGGEGKDG